MSKKYIYYILQFFICLLSLLLILLVFHFKEEPYFSKISIEDRTVEYTPTLSVNDTLCQTFVLPESEFLLENFSIAFYYENTSPDDSILIQVYQGNILTIEQPLPLSACPSGKYLPIALDTSEKYCGVPFTVSITNISADKGFSLLSTTDSVRYKNYTEGYQINDEKKEGSIFISMQYPSISSNFYEKTTKIFLLFLMNLIFSKLLKNLFFKA